MDPLKKAVARKGWDKSKWVNDGEGPVLSINIGGPTGGEDYAPTKHRTAPDGVVFDDDDQEYGDLSDGLPGDDEPDEAVYDQLADEAESLGVTEEEFPAWLADRMEQMKAGKK